MTTDKWVTSSVSQSPCDCSLYKGNTQKSCLSITVQFHFCNRVSHLNSFRLKKQSYSSPMKFFYIYPPLVSSQSPGCGHCKTLYDCITCCQTGVRRPWRMSSVPAQPNSLKRLLSPVSFILQCKHQHSLVLPVQADGSAKRATSCTFHWANKLFVKRYQIS